MYQSVSTLVCVCVCFVVLWVYDNMTPLEMADAALRQSRAELDLLLRRLSDNGSVRLNLVIDGLLTTRLNAASGGFSFLKERGVDKVYALEPNLRLRSEPGQR